MLSRLLAARSREWAAAAGGGPDALGWPVSIRAGGSAKPRSQEINFQTAAAEVVFGLSLIRAFGVGWEQSLSRWNPP